MTKWQEECAGLSHTLILPAPQTWIIKLLTKFSWVGAHFLGGGRSLPCPHLPEKAIKSFSLHPKFCLPHLIQQRSGFPSIKDFSRHSTLQFRIVVLINRKNEDTNTLGFSLWNLNTSFHTIWKKSSKCFRNGNCSLCYLLSSLLTIWSNGHKGNYWLCCSFPWTIIQTGLRDPWVLDALL